jgi:hypothetical protein
MPENEQPDRARLPALRGLLLVQVVAAGFFGLFTLLLPQAFAQLIGGSTDLPFVYRIGGSATLGYSVMALLALLRPTSPEVRIPVIATFTFTLAAAAGSLLSLGDRDARAIVFVVLLAATIFTVLAAYWLYRDEGARPKDEERIEPGFRLTLVLATASALFFGITPLLMADLFAASAGLPTNDPFIFRMAGAATLGYGVAGILEILTDRWQPIRLQVVGAVVFNALAAVSSAIYLATGGTSFLGWVMLLAAGLFAFALTWWAARAQR